MRIWQKPISVEILTQGTANTADSHLGIEFVEVGDDYIIGRVPVDARTRQPYGLLHGGISVVLAETLASMAGNFVVNPKTHYCVGLEINANHLKSATGGEVVGTARPLHIGRRTQVWEIRIEQDGKSICISRMTLAVVERTA